jgi:hypothetical protein
MSSGTWENEHQYALNSQGQWVSAIESVHTHGGRFYCDCPEKHNMKLVKPSGNPDKRTFTDYFAHVKRGNTGVELVCMPCGESVQHRLAKQKLREMQGFFSFVTSRCPSCCCEVLEDCKDGQIGIEVASVDGKWRYDCMFTAGGKHVYALEIWHTHATTTEKITSTRARGIGLAEFRAQEVLAMSYGSKLSNTQVMSVKCGACIKLAAVSDIWTSIQHEWDMLLTMDFKICKEYWQIWEYQQLDSLVASGPPKTRALAILKYFLDNGDMLLQTKRWDHFPLVLPVVTLHGIRVETDDRVPTKHCLVVLLDEHEKHSWSFLQSQLAHAKNMDIERQFVIMLNTSTILRRYSEFKASYAKSEEMYLDSCTWPILKDIERVHGICAGCGKAGHASSKCYRRFCSKCGRLGHLESNCFARKSVTGEQI